MQMTFYPYARVVYDYARRDPLGYLIHSTGTTIIPRPPHAIRPMDRKKKEESDSCL